MANESPPRRPPISQLSKTPSWVMLGFILGALFVSALPRKDPPPPRPIVVAPPSIQKAEPALKSLNTIEAVFPAWADAAVWENDTTQVALWSTVTREFDEFYEVRRVQDVYYYRSLPKLTNRLLTRGAALPPDCPLRFTESEEHYREWLNQGRPAPAPRDPIVRPTLSREPPVPPAVSAPPSPVVPPEYERQIDVPKK